jgi:hypothetical protein
MTDDPEVRDAAREVSTDLVEYLVVAVPDVDALSSVAVALADLVRAGTVRILDLVVIARDEQAHLEVSEVASVAGMAPLRGVAFETGGWLSAHDIEVSSLAVQPGMAGVVVVTEDRWAAPLSDAARRAGGQIIAGDRVAPRRVEIVLAHRSEDDA